MRYFNQKICYAFAVLLTCFSTVSYAQDSDNIQPQSGQEPESGLPKNIPANNSLRPFEDQNNNNTNNNPPSSSAAETNKGSTPPSRRIQ